LEGVKATQFADRKRPHISNIGEFTIGKLRELLRLPKQNFGLRSVYIALLLASVNARLKFFDFLKI